MERKDDIQAIRDTLSGDDAAFNTLIKKYQKSVHAFIWRKIGDYHYAEDITQDTFLKAYHKLATLRDLHSFAAWLYRIAARQCILFQREKRIQPHPLENINPKRIDKITYSQYVAEEQAHAATQIHRYIVQTLLKRLSKNERTVVTLYYLREMTCKEISRFLGISENTIKSRLHRARNRLKKTEPMVQETLDDFHSRANIDFHPCQFLPSNLTNAENTHHKM